MSAVAAALSSGQFGQWGFVPLRKVWELDLYWLLDASSDFKASWPTSALPPFELPQLCLFPLHIGCTFQLQLDVVPEFGTFIPNICLNLPA